MYCGDGKQKYWLATLLNATVYSTLSTPTYDRRDNKTNKDPWPMRALEHQQSVWPSNISPSTLLMRLINRFQHECWSVSMLTQLADFFSPTFYDFYIRKPQENLFFEWSDIYICIKSTPSITKQKKTSQLLEKSENYIWYFFLQYINILVPLVLIICDQFPKKIQFFNLEIIH